MEKIFKKLENVSVLNYTLYVCYDYVLDNYSLDFVCGLISGYQFMGILTPGETKKLMLRIIDAKKDSYTNMKINDLTPLFSILNNNIEKRKEGYKLLKQLLL